MGFDVASSASYASVDPIYLPPCHVKRTPDQERFIHEASEAMLEVPTREYRRERTGLAEAASQDGAPDEVQEVRHNIHDVVNNERRPTNAEECNPSAGDGTPTESNAR